MSSKKIRIVQIDLDTHEVQDGALAWIPKRHYFEENHISMFQSALLEIAKGDLSPNEKDVFMYLLAKAGMGNMVLISFKEAAEELGLKKPNFSRAIKGLVDRNIIIKGEQKIGRTPSLRINYGVAWKGKVKRHNVIKMYDKPIQSKLPRQPNLFD